MVSTSKEINQAAILAENEALRKEIEKLKQCKRYGLVWEDHPEALDKKNIIPLLAKDDGLSLPVIADKKQNYLIEGDNYHALKALQHTHRSAIDVIYIDPPYNTGNEFVYNDKIVDREDSFRHSKWLSFMEKRLKLARELMSDDGVIFISIDDNEQAQLKLLCDAVFGEANFINNITVKMSELKGFKMKYINDRYPKIKETVLFYAKDKSSKLSLNMEYKLKDNMERYEKYYTNSIENMDLDVSKWTLVSSRAAANPGDKVYLVSRDKELDIDVPVNSFYKHTNNAGNVEILYNKEGSMKKVLFLKDNMYEPIGDLWTDISTINLNKEGAVNFDNGKKPLKLIKRIINSFGSKNATVLDFFAGSGTTGHAVMELNKEDGGDRNFILCTNNEVSDDLVRTHFFNEGHITKNNKTEFNKFVKEHPDVHQAFLESEAYESLGIARAVTRERIKSTIEGYTTPKGKDVEGLPNNLTYLKTKEFDKKEQYGFDRNVLANLAYNSHILKYPELNYESFQVDAFTDIDAIKLTTSKQPVAFVNTRDRESLADIVEQLTSRFGNKVIIETLESYFN